MSPTRVEVCSGYRWVPRGRNHDRGTALYTRFDGRKITKLYTKPPVYTKAPTRTRHVYPNPNKLTSREENPRPYTIRRHRALSRLEGPFSERYGQTARRAHYRMTPTEAAILDSLPRPSTGTTGVKIRFPVVTSSVDLLVPESMADRIRKRIESQRSRYQMMMSPPGLAMGQGPSGMAALKDPMDLAPELPMPEPNEPMMGLPMVKAPGGVYLRYSPSGSQESTEGSGSMMMKPAVMSSVLMTDMSQDRPTYPRVMTNMPQAMSQDRPTYPRVMTNMPQAMSQDRPTYPRVMTNMPQAMSQDRPTYQRLMTDTAQAMSYTEDRPIYPRVMTDMSEAMSQDRPAYRRVMINMPQTMYTDRAANRRMSAGHSAMSSRGTGAMSAQSMMGVGGIMMSPPMDEYDTCYSDRSMKGKIYTFQLL